ncbi:Oxidoreductase AflY [Escovopsis weberi]|uniref:Oxidoreductase AflY n=1 Tax=Escovopsis weberi TaxID=150374 RepID=A0A0M8N1X3_ESCWE|nr:Oxidoreductase AflY [Escovopsis weberi]
MANSSYQVPAKAPDESIVKDLKSGWDRNCPYLGKGDHYPDFLQYFQDEIDDKGWRNVLMQYIFGEDERSEAMMQRLYAGLLHPIIQVMYGIEWDQPTIIAEGLAQAAAHENTRGDLLAQIERDAASAPSEASPMSMVEMIESVRRSEKLAHCARSDDKDHISGALERAGGEIVDLLKRVRVKPEEVDERTAEMMHAIAYVSAATAFHPPHSPRHHLNACLFFVSINQLPFITDDQKARLLEWKMRFFAIHYIALGAPPLDLESVMASPVPQDQSHNTISKPEQLFTRYHKIVDDGHTIKVVRALLVAQEFSKKYAGKEWIRLADDEAWLKAHGVLLRGTESGSPRWVFGVGFDDAWKNVPTDA